MSFVVKPVDSFKKTLVIKEPDPSRADEFIDCSVVVTWRYLPENEAKELAERSISAVKQYQAELSEFGQGQRQTAPVLSVSDLDMCKELVLDIEGLHSPDGTPLAYSEDVLVQLMKIGYVSVALSGQLRDVMSGAAVVAALEKN